MAGLPGAPTLSKPAAAGQSAPAQTTQAAAPAIPFTRAARKKSRMIAGPAPLALGAGVQQLAPIQIPANGYIRKLIVEVTGATSGNAATVAFANDAPFNIFQQLSLAAANGDSIINAMGSFAMCMHNKYGAFANQGVDPSADPTFTKVTGAGATGGSFHFQFNIPFEFDSRDGAGALANMAANQSFLLTLFLNTLANIYTTAPTTPPIITINVTAKYWAAPNTTNPQGVPQETAPRTNGVVSLLQIQTPAIVASSDQVVQLTNVGNTIRYLMFIARTAAGVRTESDWPNILQFSVNNDVWEFMTKNNWRKAMADDYGLHAGITAVPTPGALDAGVYVYQEFINDGGAGDAFVSGGSNRDLMLVTGSATALNIEAQNWGPTIAQLEVYTNSLRIPDPSAFYAGTVI